MLLGLLLAKFNLGKAFSAFLGSFLTLWSNSLISTNFPATIPPAATISRPVATTVDVVQYFMWQLLTHARGSFSPRAGMMTWHHDFPRQLCGMLGGHFHHVYIADVGLSFPVSASGPIAGFILPTYLNDDVVPPFPSTTFGLLELIFFTMCCIADLAPPLFATTFGLVAGLNLPYA